jgi:hypothetical protein
MRTITITLKAELQFGTVAAACPPALPVPQYSSVWSPVQQKQSGKQAGTGTGTGGVARVSASVVTLPGVLGASAALGATKALPAGYAGAGNIAEPASVPAGVGRTDLYRQFHTMSRRDPRSWRPPHSD